MSGNAYLSPTENFETNSFKCFLIRTSVSGSTGTTTWSKEYLGGPSINYLTGVVLNPSNAAQFFVTLYSDNTSFNLKP